MHAEPAAGGDHDVAIVQRIWHYLGATIGMGYVPCSGETENEIILASTYEIEIAGERFSAEPSLRPMYDPRSERTKV